MRPSAFFYLCNCQTSVKRGLDKDHTYVIEVDINPKDMVVPMVAPGKGVDEFVQGLGE